jgi:4a-hydroxytetrahydrobiopterin dehydratase
MARLDAADVQKRLGALSGWSLVPGQARDHPGHGRGVDGSAIRKQFTLGSFPGAIAFVTRLAFDCEAADHHPDILINYKRVTLTYSTHSEGGLTEKDFEGAARADAAEKHLHGA